MADEPVFKDFDDAEGEALEERWADVKFGDEHFKVNLNVDGGNILRWMRKGSSMEGIPLLIEIFFPDKDDYERLLNVRAPWSKYEELGLWLVSELSGESSTGKG